MAIFVRPRRSPRVVTGLAPDESFSMQEIHNQLTEWGDEPHAHAYPLLVKTSGGEDLGGGISVNYTTELQNAVWAFEPVYTVIEEGTVTTQDTTGTILEDSAATFVTNGVQPGAFVINFTDGSVQSVITVLSETKLEMFGALQNGTDNQFDIGDSYKVWNIEERSADGGNLVAVDGAGSAISPILPTFGVMVTKTSSSSATLQEQELLEYSSFQNGVTIDVVNGVPGTGYAAAGDPIGTRKTPSNNLADAKTIAVANGFEKLFIIGDITFGATDVLDTYEIHGQSQQKTTVTLTAGLSSEGATFHTATLTGTMDGDTTIRDCCVGDLTYLQGTIFDSVLKGTITLAGSDTVRLINCSDGTPGQDGIPEINLGGSGRDCIITNYNGEVTLSNLTATQDVDVSLNSGHVVLDNTITAGNFVIYGPGNYTDNSTGTTIDSSGVSSPDTTAEAVADYIVDPSNPVSIKDSLFAILATLTGIASGGGTTSITFRNHGNTADAVIMTVDEDGDRSAVTINFP